MPESRPSDLLHETDEIVTMTVASIKTLCAKQRRSRNRKFTIPYAAGSGEVTAAYGRRKKRLSNGQNANLTVPVKPGIIPPYIVD